MRRKDFQTFLHFVTTPRFPWHVTRDFDQTSTRRDVLYWFAISNKSIDGTTNEWKKNYRRTKRLSRATMICRIYVAFRQIVTVHQRHLVSHYRPMSDGKVTGDMVVLREASEIESQESARSPSCPAMNTQTHTCYKPVGLYRRCP